MKKLITPLLGLFALLCSTASIASQCVETTIVFSNGMNVKNYDHNKLGFHRQVRELKEYLKDIPEYKNVNVDYVYNKTEGFFNDVMDEAWPQSSFNDVVEEHKNTTESTLSKALIYQAESLDNEGFKNNPALEKTALKYQYYLDRGHCVVAIAHSQGNWVANWAYDYLYTRNNPDYLYKFKLISIGTPTNRVVGYNNFPDLLEPLGAVERNKFYITADGDEIINLVRSIHPTLPGNVEIVDTESIPFWHNTLAHSFVEVYLTSNETRNAINSSLNCIARMQYKHEFYSPTDSRSCRPFTVVENSIDGILEVSTSNNPTVTVSGVIHPDSFTGLPASVGFSSSMWKSNTNLDGSYNNITGEFSLNLNMGEADSTSDVYIYFFDENGNNIQQLSNYTEVLGGITNILPESSNTYTEESYSKLTVSFK